MGPVRMSRAYVLCQPFILTCLLLAPVKSTVVLTEANEEFDFWEEMALDFRQQGTNQIASRYHTQIHVLKDFDPVYAVMYSSHYLNVSREIVSALEDVRKDVPGQLAIKTISIGPSDENKLIVTVEIIHGGTGDESSKIENLIRQKLKNGILGSLEVNEQHFSFVEANDPEGCRGNDLFVCTGGMVICEVQRCNYMTDCPIGDDEKGCGCGIDEFLCDNARCISNERKCDSIQDCLDNTDENGCEGCKVGAFLCDNSRCISNEKKCDLIQDCQDNTDEEGCAECKPGEWQCLNKQCIQKSHLCDNVAHCSDYSDEKNCEHLECGNAGMAIGYGAISFAMATLIAMISQMN